MKHLAGAALVIGVVASLTFVAAGATATDGRGSTAKVAQLPALPSYVKARHK